MRERERTLVSGLLRVSTGSLVRSKYDLTMPLQCPHSKLRCLDDSPASTGALTLAVVEEYEAWSLLPAGSSIRKGQAEEEESSSEKHAAELMEMVAEEPEAGHSTGKSKASSMKKRRLKWSLQPLFTVALALWLVSLEKQFRSIDDDDDDDILFSQICYPISPPKLLQQQASRKFENGLPRILPFTGEQLVR